MNLSGMHLQALYELLTMQQEEITRLTTENQTMKRRLQTTTSDLQRMNGQEAAALTKPEVA